MELDGRVVVVTGAARGLGHAYAEALERHGARVVRNDLEEGVAADVATPEGARTVVDAALEQHGRLDAVVANAGVLRSGPILKLTAADVDAVLAVHVGGTFMIAQAAG